MVLLLLLLGIRSPLPSASWGAVAESAGPHGAVPGAWIDSGSQGAVAFAGPSRERERGVIRAKVLLPVLERSAGEGCRSGWVRVATSAWICSAGRAETVGGGVDPAAPPSMQPAAALPLIHLHPMGRGRSEYGSPADAAARRGGVPFEPGTWHAADQRVMRSGVVLFHTTEGTWLREDEIRWAVPSSHGGFDPASFVPLDRLAFVGVDRAPWFSEPPGRRSPDPGARAPGRGRYAPVLISEEVGAAVRLDGGGWLRRGDLRRFRPAAPPEGVEPDEVWFDVDLQEQMLTVYEGAVPRFVSLASTGRGDLTPPGEYRIRRAARASDMQGETLADGRRSYLVRQVPWVLFFDGDRAIHGAFWHDAFGTARSHGCVNLPPGPARRVFAVARPALPPGWMAIDAVEPGEGSRVRVRR